MTSRTAEPWTRRSGRVLTVVAALAMALALLPAGANADVGDGLPTVDDPRYGLGAGEFDAETAALGMNPVGFFDKRESPFFDPASSLSSSVGAAIATANSDLAFTTDGDGRDHVIQGNWQGFQIFDVSNPEDPVLRTAVLCPGGQGDLTVLGNLAFHSVQDSTARIDCGTGTLSASEPDPERMRGVRIWDISDLDNPVQVGHVQTCRGSHTHRLVEDPSDSSVAYIYNNGTSSQRHPGEAVHTPEGFVDGRCGQVDPTGENPSAWMIEVIRVPLANPGAAEVVNEARLFQDFDTGAVNGLLNGRMQPEHPCATDDLGACTPAGTGYNPNTNTCHDITAYPEIGLAAGACQGNGILIDISDPANPVRIDDVVDVNFAYWHSANFNNDGTSVMFTDEWGGGTGARCAPNHRMSWGANALFSIDRSGDTPKLVFESYYKLPVAQMNTENCVAHQANILPVPNRDILVQGWYQGGISVFDWTDPAKPFEIAYFDRGPIREDALVLGGYWSGYWFNGHLYGAEIARGLDTFEVTPTGHLSANEIAAMKTVQLDEHNAMSMRRLAFPLSVPLARATGDQLLRDGRLTAEQAKKADGALAQAEHFLAHPSGKPQTSQVQHHLDRAVRELEKDASRGRGDVEALRELADLIKQVRGSL